MTYILDGDDIITPSGRYYLREVVDPYCTEWSASDLSDDQRRAIIEVIGPEPLAEALQRLYAADKHLADENAAQTIKLAQWRLYGHAHHGEAIGD
jgi:hypothetical protein